MDIKFRPHEARNVLSYTTNRRGGKRKKLISDSDHQVFQPGTLVPGKTATGRAKTPEALHQISKKELAWRREMAMIVIQPICKTVRPRITNRKASGGTPEDPGVLNEQMEAVGKSRFIKENEANVGKKASEGI